MVAKAKPQAMADYITGPQSAPLVRRSQYLADTLKALQDSRNTNGIRTGGQLGAELLADAITQRSIKKNDASLSKAQAAELEAEASSFGAPAPQSNPLADAISPPVQPQPAPITSAALPDISTPPQQPGLSQYERMGISMGPQEKQALAQMVYGEARGEPPVGQQATASVALNRAAAAGQPVDQIVGARGQFEGFNPQARSLDMNNPQLQAVMQNVQPLLDGSASDPTGGAQNFYSPGAQAQLGRQPPSWDDGSGQMIGHQLFFGGQQPSPQPPQQMAQAQPPAPAQPYQVASNGPTPAPPMQPQPSAGPPVPSGTAPVATPQAAPTGATPQGPTPQQVALYQQWIRSGDPRKVEAARQFRMSLEKQAVEPPKYDVNVTRGGQVVRVDPQSGETHVSDVPGFRQQLSGNLQYGPDGRAMPIPGTEMHVVSAQQAGIPAPAGTTFNEAPGGAKTPLYQPPAGYQSQGNTQSYVPGSQADPARGSNRLEGLKGFRAELKPVVDAAQAFSRNINAVNAGYSQHNGSGDIAMVNGLQRLTDEGVVREGDVNLQLKSQGLEGGLAGLMGYLGSSGKFDDSIRNKILKAATDIYHANNEVLKQRAMSYRGVVDRTYGQGAFEDVLPSDLISAFGWNGQPKGNPNGQPNANSAGGSGGGMGAAPSRPQYSPQDIQAEIARRRKAGLVK